MAPKKRGFHHHNTGQSIPVRSFAPAPLLQHLQGFDFECVNFRVRKLPGAARVGDACGFVYSAHHFFHKVRQRFATKALAQCLLQFGFGHTQTRSLFLDGGLHRFEITLPLRDHTLAKLRGDLDPLWYASLRCLLPDNGEPNNGEPSYEPTSHNCTRSAQSRSKCVPGF